MDDPGASLDIEKREPAEIFAALASETRVEILEALGDPPGEPLPFSALFDTVSIADSGNFSYHLNELVGPFVRKSEGGYLLTHAGEQVVGSILAGTYQADAAVEPTPFDATCQLCDGELIFEYTDEHAHIRCRDCGQGRTLPFPPGCLSDYSVTELPAVTARWYRTRVQRVTDGFCPVCSGELSGELVQAVEPEAEPPQPSIASFGCHRCGKQLQLSGATIATFHPVVEGFLFEHGFDTRTGPHSEVWGELDNSTEENRSHDPLSVEVTFTHDDACVQAVVGPDASVTYARRR